MAPCDALNKVVNCGGGGGVVVKDDKFLVTKETSAEAPEMVLDVGVRTNARIYQVWESKGVNSIDFDLFIYKT